MRQILRWLLRLVQALGEEWGKARIDRRAAEAEHAVRALVVSERAIFRTSIAGLVALHQEAARGMAAVPAAGDIVCALYEERMAHLASAIGAATGRDTRAA